MTPNEERQYLCDLLLEASRWRISEDDAENGYNGLELEVRDRLQKLNAEPTEEPPEEQEPEEPARDYSNLTSAQRKARRFRDTHVHLLVDGKYCYKPKDECHREKIPGFANRERWVWDGPREQVDKLGDELWNEHEAEK